MRVNFSFSTVQCTVCARFFGKIDIFSVKSTFLVMKLLKSWFHEIFFFWWDRICAHSVVLCCVSQFVEEPKIYCVFQNIPSNQFTLGFISDRGGFTKFSRKNGDSTVWKLRKFTFTLFWQKFRESKKFTKEIYWIVDLTKFFFSEREFMQFPPCWSHTFLAKISWK